MKFYLRLFTFFLALITGVAARSAATEGVKTAIDASRLQEVQAWLNNSKVELSNALSLASDSPIERQEPILALAIESVLQASHGKNEFLMRNVLYRTQEIYKILLAVPSEPKRDYVARRILKETITKALSLYETDLSIYKNQEIEKTEQFLRPVEFARLGLDWSTYMLNIHYLMPTTESRLRSLEVALGLLYNDLLDDSQYNRLLAPVAKDIAAFQASKSNLPITTQNEKLGLSRELRAFLEREVKIGFGLLGDVSLEAKRAPTPPPPPPSIGKINSWTDVENFVITRALLVKNRSGSWLASGDMPALTCNAPIRDGRFCDDPEFGFTQAFDAKKTNTMFPKKDDNSIYRSNTRYIGACNSVLCIGDLLQFNDAYRTTGRVLAVDPSDTYYPMCLGKSGPYNGKVFFCDMESATPWVATKILESYIK